LIQKASPQGTLKQFEPGERIAYGRLRSQTAAAGPSCLDLAHPLINQFVVDAVRPAMQWQSHPEGGAIRCRQQETVAPEIIKPEPLPPDRAKQRCRAILSQQLHGQQVVSLHARIEIGPITQVYGAKRQPAAVSALPADHGLLP
jgi:hypothetical protein